MAGTGDLHRLDGLEANPPGAVDRLVAVQARQQCRLALAVVRGDRRNQQPDDALRIGLQAHLARMQPVEVHPLADIALDDLQHLREQRAATGASA